MTPASVNGLVALDNSQRSKMTLVTTILPLVTGIVGVILLIVGILLSRRREDVEGGASATSPELAAAEPEDADRSAESATRPSLVPGLDDEPHEATAEAPAAEAPPSSKRPPSPKPRPRPNRRSRCRCGRPGRSRDRPARSSPSRGPRRRQRSGRGPRRRSQGRHGRDVRS